MSVPVDKGGRDAVLRGQRSSTTYRQEPNSARAATTWSPAFRDAQNGGGDGCHAAGGGAGGVRTFEETHALFEHCNGWVGVARIDKAALILTFEALFRLLRQLGRTDSPALRTSASDISPKPMSGACRRGRGRFQALQDAVYILGGLDRVGGHCVTSSVTCSFNTTGASDKHLAKWPGAHSWIEMRCARPFSELFCKWLQAGRPNHHRLWREAHKPCRERGLCRWRPWRQGSNSARSVA